MARELYVDGHSPEDGVFMGATNGDTVAPYVVFDADKQENIAGPFDTWEEAEQHRLDILNGAAPRLDAPKLGRWIDELDA